MAVTVIAAGNTLGFDVLAYHQAEARRARLAGGHGFGVMVMALGVYWADRICWP